MPASAIEPDNLDGRISFDDTVDKSDVTALVQISPCSILPSTNVPKSTTVSVGYRQSRRPSGYHREQDCTIRSTSL